MPTIRVAGVRQYAGDYEFDAERAFTTLEWRWVKKIGGYYPLTLDEGFRNLDPDLFLALAIIAMHRTGKVARDDAYEVAEILADAPFGETITIIGSEEGDEEGPLATTPDA